jgi:integrase
MSAFMDKVVSAVVERMKYMAHLKQKRRSPRPYTKRLKASSRGVPAVVLPTGPMPEDPWYDPNEDEAEVPLIGEAILAYHKEHSHRAKMTMYQSDRAIAAFLTASKLHENEPIFVVTREQCKRWRNALIEAQHNPTSTSDSGVTPNRNKRVAGAVTIEKRLAMVRHWFAWCVQKEWMPTNPMDGLSLPKRLVSSSKVRKTSFSDVELAKIIPALLALPATDLPRTEFKWCALALLFSGARCMEVLQLKHKDVKQVDGYWVFDIQATDTDNRVKNHPSIRLLPIHSQLIELGFLEWAMKQSKTSGDDGRVFPLVHPKGSTLVSMWFSRLLTALQIKRPEVSLHSARHTMTVLLAKQKTYPPLQNRLLGHAIGKSVEDRVYMAGLQFSVKELSEALERISYPTLAGEVGTGGWLLFQRIRSIEGLVDVSAAAGGGFIRHAASRSRHQL